MTTIGQVTTGGMYHINLHGLAACGSGSGRILRTTIIPATDPSAWGKCCQRCQAALRREVTLAEARAALPKGYRINPFHQHYMASSNICGHNWSNGTISPWEALRAARQDAGRRAHTARIAREERERQAQQRKSVSHTHCRECGTWLTEFDLVARSVEGYCFNCA